MSGGDSPISSARGSGTAKARITELAHVTDDPVRAVANRASEPIAAIMRGAVDSIVSQSLADISCRRDQLGRLSARR
jgi:hypothetical protein